MSTHPLIGLKTVREALGYRAQDLADRLGCTVTTYYRYEKGTRRIFFDQALAISQLLQVATDTLTQEPTLEERIELIRRGETRRKLMDSDVGAEVATVLSDWFDPPAGSRVEGDEPDQALDRMLSTIAVVPDDDEELSPAAAKIMSGLEDAIAYTQGDTSRGTAHHIEVSSSTVVSSSTIGIQDPALAQLIRDMENHSE